MMVTCPEEIFPILHQKVNPEVNPITIKTRPSSPTLAGQIVGDSVIWLANLPSDLNNSEPYRRYRAFSDERYLCGLFVKGTRAFVHRDHSSDHPGQE
jgi:hypothetical protein